MQNEPGLEAMPRPGKLRLVDLQPVVLPVKASATGPQAMRAAFITTSTHIPAAMRAMVMLPLFYSESKDVFPVVSEMRCKFGSKTISTDVCIPGPEAMPSPWAMQPGVALVEAAATASPAFDRLQRLLN